MRLLPGLMTVALLAGCSGKEGPDKKPGDDSKVMDKDEGPPKTDGKPPGKDHDPPGKDSQQSVEPSPAGQVNSDVLSQEFRDEAEKAKGKYHGKVLEVIGPVVEMGMTATAEAYVVLEGVQVPVVRTIECVMSEKEPWRKVVPGQKCTLKGRCEYLGGELRIKECKVAGATGPGRILITSAELSERYEKDAAAAEKEFAGRYVELAGTLDKVQAEDRSARLTLSMTAKVSITCHLAGGMADRARKLRPGARITLLGKPDAYNAADGIVLKGCLLFE
jgi:hypothetical protein